MAAASASQAFQPRPSCAIACTYAPVPKKTACPNENWPP
jgi:hypothetical protein